MTIIKTNYIDLLDENKNNIIKHKVMSKDLKELLNIRELIKSGKLSEINLSVFDLDFYDERKDVKRKIIDDIKKSLLENSLIVSKLNLLLVMCQTDLQKLNIIINKKGE